MKRVGCLSILYTHPYNGPLALDLRGLILKFTRCGPNFFQPALKGGLWTHVCCKRVFICEQAQEIGEMGSVNSDDMSAKYFPEPVGLPSVVSKKYIFVSSPPSHTGHVLINEIK